MHLRLHQIWGPSQARGTESASVGPLTLVACGISFDRHHGDRCSTESRNSRPFGKPANLSAFTAVSSELNRGSLIFQCVRGRVMSRRYILTSNYQMLIYMS